MILNVAFEPEVWNPEWNNETVEDEFEGFYRLALWERTHPKERMEIIEKLSLELEEKKKTSSM